MMVYVLMNLLGNVTEELLFKLVLLTIVGSKCQYNHRQYIQMMMLDLESRGMLELLYMRMLTGRTRGIILVHKVKVI